MSEVIRENPAHPAEEVGRVSATDPTGVDAVVRTADFAQRAWGARTLDNRRELLTAAVDTIGPDVLDSLSRIMTRELGKPIPDSRGEIGFASVFMKYCIDAGPRVLGDHTIDDAMGRIRVRRAPFGVVAAITPWNAPVILAMLKVAPALVAGNAIVVKPSPLAPLAVTEYFELLARELPEGLLTVIHGGPETGEALVAHPLVRKVAFTGGETVARAIGITAAQAIKPTVMELGGNDAAIFLDDAVLDDGAFDRIVVATYATSGQVCMASKRIYVPSARIHDFVDGFLAAGERLVRLGDPLDDGVTVGPVVTRAAQIRLDALTNDTRRLGAEVRDVGTVDQDALLDQGYFVRPTVALGLDDSAPLVAEEQFGPIVPILPYTDVDEVLARANSTELGLGASVWSADEERAFDVAARIEAGFTFINTHNRTGMSQRAPFGGVKRSGFGREYSDEGLLEYVQSVTIHAPAAFRGGGSGASATAYPGQ